MRDYGLGYNTRQPSKMSKPTSKDKSVSSIQIGRPSLYYSIQSTPKMMSSPTNKTIKSKGDSTKKKAP